MRTQEEILERIKIIKDGDLFGFGTSILVQQLDYNNALPYLAEGATAELWGPAPTEDQLRAELTDYMPFAWEKVENHRGLSASLSVSKCTEWAWLLASDDSILHRIERAGYPKYGAPQLAVICKAYNLAMPADPLISNMIAGRPCSLGCKGCGS